MNNIIFYTNTNHPACLKLKHKSVLIFHICTHMHYLGTTSSIGEISTWMHSIDCMYSFTVFAMAITKTQKSYQRALGYCSYPCHFMNETCIIKLKL